MYGAALQAFCKVIKEIVVEDFADTGQCVGVDILTADYFADIGRGAVECACQPRL